MQLLSFAVSQLDLPSVVAGHGYDVGNDVRSSGGRGSGGGGGISLYWILAGVVLTLFAVAVLVSLDPSAAMAILKKLAPGAAILGLVGAPLVAWTTLAGGGAKSLIVERWTNDAGIPELIFSIGKRDLNVLATNNGKGVVRLECVSREREVVLEAEQKWPFLDERGYDYPHVHQQGTREQVQQAESCRLIGTQVRLVAGVKGLLTGRRLAPNVAVDGGQRRSGSGG
jgi:hypothetical protein